MKELLGFATLIVAIAYYNNSESAQKIENIKNLYELKTNLENRKSLQETEEFIQNTQKLIDSIEKKQINKIMKANKNTLYRVDNRKTNGKLVENNGDLTQDGYMSLELSDTASRKVVSIL